MSLSRCCKLFGISRQSVQAEHRHLTREQELVPVWEMVQDIRVEMPRIGTRKLHHLIKDELESREITLGRDGLFRYLRKEHLLIRPVEKTPITSRW